MKWFMNSASCISSSLCWDRLFLKCWFNSCERSSTNELTKQHEPTKRQTIGTVQINPENVPAHCVSSAIKYPNGVCQSNGNLDQSETNLVQFISTNLVTRTVSYVHRWDEQIKCFIVGMIVRDIIAKCKKERWCCNSSKRIFYQKYVKKFAEFFNFCIQFVVWSRGYPMMSWSYFICQA